MRRGTNTKLAREMMAAKGLREAQHLIEVTGGFRGAVMALLDASLDYAPENPDMVRVQKVLGNAADKLRGA